MTPQELFQKLAEKRKELDLSIEEVVEKTKLYPSVIRDIEAGNLENINPAYRKGFLRIYASFLGVDASAVLDKLSLNGPKKEKTVQFKDPAARPKKAISIKLPPVAKKIIIFTAAALCMLWILGSLVSFVAKRISRLPKKPQRVAERQAPATFTTQRPKTNVLNVSLTAKRACFLKVKVDGKLLFEGELPKGAQETWRGTREIELLKISDGSALFLEVNSKRISPLSTSRRQIKSLKITASGISVVK